jgi:hypothetical protein
MPTFDYVFKHESPFVKNTMGDTPPDGKLYGAVLPGNLMPWMWITPNTWLPPGYINAPRYHLSESVKYVNHEEFWGQVQNSQKYKLAPPPTGGHMEWWDRQHAYGRYLQRCAAYRYEPRDYQAWVARGRHDDPRDGDHVAVLTARGGART